MNEYVPLIVGLLSSPSYGNEKELIINFKTRCPERADYELLESIEDPLDRIFEISKQYPKTTNTLPSFEATYQLRDNEDNFKLVVVVKDNFFGYLSLDNFSQDVTLEMKYVTRRNEDCPARAIYLHQFGPYRTKLLDVSPESEAKFSKIADLISKEMIVTCKRESSPDILEEIIGF